MYHKKHAYCLEIDINNTKCPVCGKKHLKMNIEGDISCSCGYYNSNAHIYCGGQRVNNLLSFKLNKVRPES